MMGLDPNAWSLFLDLDGTLIDIASSPTEVRVPPGLTGELARLERAFGGALALVTGRAIVEVDGLLAPLRPIVAGIHGTQVRRMPGGPTEMVAHVLPTKLVAALTALAGFREGLVIEVKPTAVSVHYRQAPEAKADVERAIRAIVARYDGMVTVSHGRMVIEVLPAAFSKGRALRALCAMAPFAGRKPLMIGDDLPDVSALRVAAELGGRGMTVGGECFAAASADFADAAAVRAWLAALARGADPTGPSRSANVA